MPLLRLKPFKPEVVPAHLKEDDEVFLCDLTGEVFIDYEAFYQRMILCNSLVWSCEISGKVNLTYKEAQENEKAVRKSLSAIPYSLKRGMLYCVHHTRRSKIQDLTDEIYEYFKTRYQIDEKVEVKIKDKWTEGIISELPYSVDITLQNKLNNQKSLSPINSPSKEKLKAFCTILASLKSKSPLENKELKPDTSDLSYKVLILNGPKKGETVVLKRKCIRRLKKGVFVKDKIKLFLKETCNRSTTSSDDGYWVVQKKESIKYELGPSCIIKPSASEYHKDKKKTVKAYLERPNNLPQAPRPNNLALEQKKIEQRKIEQEEREKKRLELEALKEQKLKEEKALKEQKLKEKEEEKARKKDEREEEKARKKDERERERELNMEKKNLELDFVREFNKVKEDLLLEDSKALPALLPLKSALDKELIGGAIMVVEFVNTYASLFDLEQEIDGDVNLEWLEEALLEHDAEGKYFTILKFLLHSYLRLDKEENKYEPDDDDDGSSSDNSTGPVAPPTNISESFKGSQQKASANASAAAAWSMLHQGMALSDISIEPFSLTEVLRLHILSSGIQIGGIVDMDQWQRRGQNQLYDDPCVSFRHREQEIMKRIMTSSVYDLSPSDKLKILNLLCDQCLTLSTTREFIEDALDKVKILRKELREIQFEENQRRRQLQKEKWKKKVEERKKLKEETKLKKEKKLLELQLQQSESKPGTPVSVEACGEDVVGVKDGDKDKDTDENTVKDSDKEEPSNITIDPKEQEEIELEKKRKKEEKEQQIDDFYHEKFLFREKEILKEISELNGRVSETPVGTDRYFRRYWNFNFVDGLLVEKDESAQFEPSDSDSDDSDTENEGDNEMSEDEERSHQTENMDTTMPEGGLNVIPPGKGETSSKQAAPIPSLSKVTFDDVMNAKQEGVALTRLILNRYGCNYTERSEEFVSKSPALSQLMDNIKNGIDTRVCSQVNDIDKWYNISDKDTHEALLATLNMRGIRESNLHNGLSNTKPRLTASQAEESEKLLSKKTKSGNDQDGNDIDKSLFETMDDYIEGNLRDHLLEIEERLWVGGIGAIKCEDRIKWRSDIEQGMVKLIKYDRNKNTEEASLQEPKAAINGKDQLTDNVNAESSCVHGSDSLTELREESETKVINDDISENALVSHLKLELSEDISRCSTPVNVPVNEKLVLVKELAAALLLIEKGIERKFLKPPLGETDEIKREKLKEMLEASGDNSKEEEEKKSSTCLSRWEESLISSISFAQIFIHLDTLDRSILWDKSIQNTKCRLCRRKGNEDEMLLCDGCDRGFHMSCLKPKLKSVPEGDWFCNDCRPIEIKKRSRKLSVKDEDDTEEEDESEDETEEEDSQDSDSQSDGEEDEEEDDASVGTEHGEHCTVCNEEGTLILCDECPRSYHVGCCYPRLKKVPRGSWSCQICTGSDKELPWKKRAKTLERNRERALLESQEKPKKRQYKKKQQQVKVTKEKKRNSSPLVSNKPAKKARLSNDQSPGSSQRSSGLFRFQLKHCSTLINEIFNQEEAEDFLLPVDIDEVPDYLNFIDKPMDFGNIKRKLNMAKYVDIQDFLSDVYLVFSNCETYNPPRSRVYREGTKLKSFVLQRVKELGLS